MKVVDLTLTVSSKIPTFPGSPQPNFIPWENIKEDGYNLELLFLSSHTGTHMDAPHHFLQKGVKIHEISLEKLVSEAALIKSKKNGGEIISKTDIQKFEKKHGKIEGFSSVIFQTGWQKNLQKNITLLRTLVCQFQLRNILHLKRSVWLALIHPVLMWVQTPSFPFIKSLQKKEC